MSNFHAQQKYFIVEGNIGAGKSTFLRILKERLGAQVVYEPTDRWQQVGGTNHNILEKFYQDTPRWAYTFQSYAFITRLMAQEQHAKQNPFAIQILERSVFSDRYCFAKNCYELGLMSELEWSMYQEWFEWLVTRSMPRPHGFIYLHTDPEICFDRLKKRNRSEETGVSREYLQLLHDKHHTWLVEKQGVASYLKDIPVLVLSCNEEFETSVAVQNAHMQAVSEFCNQGIPTDSKQATFSVSAW